MKKFAETRTNPTIMEHCVVCKKNVDDKEQGLKYDLCDQWEHISCCVFCQLKDQAKLAVYEVVIENRSKAIFMCALLLEARFCSVSKCLYKFEINMNEHAKSGWPACTH